MFKEHVPSIISRVLTVVGFSICIIILIVSPYTLGKIMHLFHLYYFSVCILLAYALTNAVRNKQKGSAIALFGFAIFIIFIINDLLNASFIIRTIHLAHVGVVVLILSQSFMLSLRYSSTFAQIDAKSQVC